MAGAHFFVELDGSEEAASLGRGEFDLGGEVGVFKKSGDASSVFGRQAGLGLGNFGGGDLADADGLDRKSVV